MASGRLGVAVRDGDARLLECNARFAEIFDTTPEALVGTHPADIMEVDSASASASLAAERWAAASPDFDLERWITTRDGRRILIRLTVCPVLDPDGAPLHLVVLVDDITEQYRLEQQRAQAEHADSIGRLAGAVAHELNNKLAVIIGYGERIAAQLGAGHPLQRELTEVRAAAALSAGLTQDLLAFGRRQALEREPIVMSGVLAGLQRVLAPALGAQFELRIDDRSEGAVVMGDRAQLRQVLFGIALNARDAMPHGGRLAIEMSTVGADDGGQRVRIVVSDTGIGMTEEVRSRVFEPFFTTKQFGQGAGLGLAKALGVVEQSGGTISVASRAGEGTTVVVELPAAP